MRLQGKRVLITGGSSRIGFAIAEAMLAAGATIAITGRRSDVLADAIKELGQYGRRAESVAADGAKEGGRRASLKLAFDKLGGLDFLVNNAGGVRAGKLEDTTEPKSER